MKHHRNWLSLFWPMKDGVSFGEKLLSGLGGLVSIALIMWVSSRFLAPRDLPWVVASMGASAVLLFAVPLGPLSQPWNLVGGHLISGAIGVTVAQWVPDLITASALAVSLAIFVMYVTRCLHPPGGATALTVVAGGAGIQSLGYQYLITPVLINVVVMLAWALLINNLLPRRYYPNTLKAFLGQRETQPGDDRIRASMSISPDDLQYALREVGEFVDVSEDDLARLFQISATHARRRRMGDILVGQIMTRDVISARYDTPVEDIWRLMGRHKIRGIPVIDDKGRVLGIVTIADFLNQVKADDGRPLQERLLSFLKPTPGLTTDKPEYAGHVMTSPAETIDENRHILDLFPIFYDKGFHHLPVVDDRGRLVGMVTPKNLLIALHADIESAVSGERP